jgi:hypothetical protein
MSQLVQLEMPDGQSVWAMVEAPDGPSDAGLGETAVEKLHGFQESLRALAANTRSAVAAAQPHEVTVEFGLELTVGKAGVFAALVGAGGKAAVKVTLKWVGGGDAPESMIPSQPEQRRSNAV